MIAKIKLRAFIRGISLIMLFITFFNNYLFFHAQLLEALLRGLITYVVTSLVLHAIIFVWRFAFSPSEWKLIIEGEKSNTRQEIFGAEESASK